LKTISEAEMEDNIRAHSTEFKLNQTGLIAVIVTTNCAQQCCNFWFYY